MQCPKPKRKKSRKGLIRRLDKAFADAIKAGSRLEFDGICPFCMKEPIQQCFHFITRAKYATRWMEENAVGSCAGCNLQMEYNPHPFITWFIKKYGVKEYEWLVEQSNKIVKFSDRDLEDMIDKWTKRSYEISQVNVLGPNSKSSK